MNDMTVPNFCIDCRFYDPDDADDAARGRCRRYAPKPSLGTVSWPITADNDWCGDFKGRGWCAKAEGQPSGGR